MVEPKTFRDSVKATPEQILKAPRGDLIHRIWKCKHTEHLRCRHAPEADVRAMKDVEARGHPAWERGLTVRPTPPRKNRSKVETFRWHTRPDGPVSGTVYTDGSARDGPLPELLRCGWSFIVIDDTGKIIAAAYGVPPPWITDIGGSEAWALYQAMLCTIPGSCRYWTDCYPVMTAVAKGPDAGRDPRNPLARIHGMIHTAMEDTCPDIVGWMPAHLTSNDVARGTATKSDGSLVTPMDVWGE